MLAIKEAQMEKERLINVLNALMQVEVKGTNTLIIADCLRELQTIINDSANEEREAPNASN